MSGMKRMIDEARDDGMDAFHDGFAREQNPHVVGSVLYTYWAEGWDYAQDQEIIGRPQPTEEQLEAMFEYHFGTPA